MNPHVGIAWQIGSTFGWGVYGTQLALGLTRRGRLPTLLESPGPLTLDALEGVRLKPAMEFRPRLVELIQKQGEGPIVCQFPVLHARGNNAELQFGRLSPRIRGTANHACIFFDRTTFSPEAIAQLNRFDSVIAGSAWNGAYLRDLGVRNVIDNIQGVDVSRFHPAPRRGLLGDRFAIFSGGKIEHRKGQDIVAAAFRAFRQRHDDAVLVTSWHNAWPRAEGVREIMRSKVFDGADLLDGEGRIDVRRWLSRNGVPEDSVIALPEIPNALLPPVIRECDVAIFPNRCEGGTNLVAMETLALGVPSLLSANTGHMDLLDRQIGFALADQSPVPEADASPDHDVWGESSVDEIVERLEAVYRNREAFREVALAHARLMEDLSWTRQIDRLLVHLGI
ncbi:MAG: glycosyltransferase family 4 protein [Phenylobacterium sp.]|uniref:glycosyltransferase family 4 protein n=1 Tax=Phenylobacterium sp. TaxID=1871053 RepID=UPI0025F360F0|nr:glycosyltransferase family 4 protein [Phenylobacterium sp.]MCA6297876.1 glycosyltransferase family 4 protein [Phenylobacterium sp.]